VNITLMGHISLSSSYGLVFANQQASLTRVGHGVFGCIIVNVRNAVNTV